jgi:SAM-dependent methyltransferase
MPRGERVEPAEIRKLAAVEDRHWWYAERRAILRRLASPVTTGAWALDVGAAGGGNTRVLADAGFRSVAVEYGAEGAAVAHSRGVTVVRGDATRLPFRDESATVMVAFDVLEHIDDDGAAARELARVLMPGGHVLVAVPAGPALWSAHDEAVGHVRRYTREALVGVLTAAGLEIDRVWSWNVLLRPMVRARRRRSAGSDLDETAPVLNAVLRAVVVAERWLPVGRLPGVTLMAVARRPVA